MNSPPMGARRQVRMQPDENEIRRALDVLFAPGDVVEVRAFPNRRNTISGYYNDFDKLAKDAAKINMQAGGVYVTLNRINPDLLARRANRYEQHASTTTSDDQVVLRRWFPIDLDPVRPAEISASDDEHDAAIERARQVHKYLVQELGWPRPVAADSGNGAHLLFRIDLPNDADAAGLVQAGLQALHLRFSDDKITVDTGNYNAARIWKLYGTVAGKGDDTESRPHRVARLLHVPEVVEAVPIEKLQALAAMAPHVNEDHRQPGRSTSSRHNANGHLDVGEWLKQHSIPVLHEQVYKGQLGRGQKWVLERCQWNADHTDKSAYIIQFDNGAISAGCQHNSCQGKGWHDLRDVAEPGWRERRAGRSDHTPASPTAKAARNLAAPPWRSFPVEVLPDSVRSYVTRVSGEISCDASYIALPMLCMFAGAIGNSRQISVRRGLAPYVQPAVLWGAIVGDSGTMKSPALDIATKAIKRRQARAVEEYRKKMEIYDGDLEEYKLALDNWRKAGRKKGEPKPEEPETPICRRCYCSDITVEALADRLHENPRGLLLVRDELAGWIRSFDQYKGGRGADAAHWLAMYGASDLMVDRKTGDRKMTFVPRAAVSICGGIQPEVLAQALGREHIVDGLAPRLLVTMPPRFRKQWSEPDVNEQVDRQIDELLGRLYTLEPALDENDQPEPVTVGMTPEGKAAWVKFFNEHAAVQAEATGERAAVLSKIEGAAARLALVVHLVRWAAGDTTLAGSDRVDGVSIGAGVTMARWFANEADRVHMVLHETEEDRERRRIIELVERNGRKITPRQLRQSMRRFKDSTEAAEQALDGLVQAGAGFWESVNPGPRGGRPTRVFCLPTASTVYETPTKPGKETGFVDVDTGDEAQVNRKLDEVVEPDDTDDWGEV